MQNSHQFFANKECKYYPCHEGMEEMNCLFCYCPMYRLENCPGNPYHIEKDGRRIKVCTDCTFPHRAENYDRIICMLRDWDL